MRTAEVERLAVLRKKVKSPQGLTEKEALRLQQLEELERNDSSDKKETISNVPSGRPAGSDTASGAVNNSGGSNTGGGKGGRSESRGTEQGERTQRTLDAPGTSGQARNSVSPNGEPAAASGGETQQHGDTFGEYRGEVGSNPCSGSTGETGKTVVHAATNSGVKPPKSTKIQKTSKQTTKETTPEDVYSVILMSGFGLIANVTNRKHWEIDKDEADSVSVPLSKMLDSMSSANKKKLEKAMNPIMLGSAVAGIVIPRLMVDITMMKGAKYHVISPEGNTRTAQSIGTGDIQTTIELEPTEYGGTTDTNTEAVTPNVTPEIAGLFNTGN